MRNYRAFPIKWTCFYYIQGIHELQVKNSWSKQGYRKVEAKGTMQRNRKVERWMERATGKQGGSREKG